LHNQYLLVEAEQKVPEIPEIGSNRYDLASTKNLEEIDKTGDYVFDLDINADLPKAAQSDKGNDSSVVSYGELTPSEESEQKEEVSEEPPKEMEESSIYFNKKAIDELKQK
jgi:hypothetical protein